MFLRLLVGLAQADCRPDHAVSVTACDQCASMMLRRRMAELRKAERAALMAALVAYELPADGHEGYAKVSIICHLFALVH